MNILPFENARNCVGIRCEYVTNNNSQVTYYKLKNLNIENKIVLIFLASAGREVSDYNEIAELLLTHGYWCVLIQSPLIDGSVCSKNEPTLFDLAADIYDLYCDIVHNNKETKCIIVGHAFGNRLARAFAASYPEIVMGVILLAAGGKIETPVKAAEALQSCFNEKLELRKRLKSIQYAFFASKCIEDIPDYWIRGWHKDAARMQGHASRSTPSELWWNANDSVKILAIGGKEDTIAPLTDSVDLLQSDFPDRVTAIRLDNAGHALLPEKPQLIAQHMLQWLSFS